MDISFENKVIVVTGASTGIGAATALEFGRNGASVAVNYYQSKKAAENVVEEIISHGGKAIAIQADVSQKKEVERLMNTTVDTFGGPIDVLVNNAGGLVERVPFQELTAELLNQCIELNLNSVYLCSRAVIPLMKQNGAGHIINISSIAARNGGGWGAGHYACTKAAVSALTKNMAKELAPFGIIVNNVAPGIITTPFHDKFTSTELREKFKTMIPVAREGEPAEVAYTILFLASGYAQYIVGETIEINGGMLMD